MGIAKRQKWEKRTKSAELTLLHSKIRRLARAFLRERPSLQTSIIFAVRRVCAVIIQKWWRKYMPRKMGLTKAIKRFCAIRIQRWARSEILNSSDTNEPTIDKPETIFNENVDSLQIISLAPSNDSLPELEPSKWDKFQESNDMQNETENMSVSLLSAFKKQKRNIAKKFKRLTMKRKKNKLSKSILKSGREQKRDSKSLKHKSPFAIARRLVSSKRLNNDIASEKIWNDNKASFPEQMDESSFSSFDDETDDDVNTMESRRANYSIEAKNKRNYDTILEDDSISSQSQNDTAAPKEEEIFYQSYIELDDDDNYGGFDDEDRKYSLHTKDTQSKSIQSEFVFDPFNILTGIEIVPDEPIIKHHLVEHKDGSKLDTIG